MIKHTQKICRQTADELFECVWSFCGVGTKVTIISDTYLRLAPWDENFNLRLLRLQEINYKVVNSVT